MSRHGSCAVLLLQVSGNWDALARLETLLPPLAKRALMSAGLEQVADFKTGGIPVVVLVGEIARNR